MNAQKLGLAINFMIKLCQIDKDINPKLSAYFIKDRVYISADRYEIVIPIITGAREACACTLPSYAPKTLKKAKIYTEPHNELRLLPSNRPEITLPLKSGIIDKNEYSLHSVHFENIKIDQTLAQQREYSKGFGLYADGTLGHPSPEAVLSSYDNYSLLSYENINNIGYTQKHIVIKFNAYKLYIRTESIYRDGQSINS